MKSRITLFLSLMICCLAAAAQTLSVTSFKPLPNDLTANIAGTMVKDQNGEVAALIKVVTTQTGFAFEGGMAGIVKTQQRIGEIWVYVPHGIQKITILHQTLGVLRDYYFPCAIEAARTYEMVLASGEVRTVVTQDAGGSYLMLSVEPKNAVVYIDEQMQASDGTGEYIAALPYGEHQYRVEAGSYMPEAGVVSIGKEKKSLSIKLQSALASIAVNSTTPGTQIYVNDKLRGTGSWTGNLPAGMYIIEGRLDGHRSQKQSVTLAKQDQKIVTLPALEAIVGSLDVRYKPLGAEVWLDGKQLGSSPDLFRNILVGNHSLVIKKAGCAEYSETITLAEGETKLVSGTLQQGREITISCATAGAHIFVDGTDMGASPFNGSLSFGSHKVYATAGGKRTAERTVDVPNGTGALQPLALAFFDNVNKTFTVKGVKFTMVAVEGGTFTMGATSEQGSDAAGDEKPTHQVTLSSYYIGKTEVTQALWKAVMGKNPSKFKGDNLPVENVSWDDCQEFIKKLNALTGKNFRLPTEAEWEYAARGGNKSRSYKYSGSNNIDDVAWYNKNSENRTHPVKTKQSNELGIYDMNGNVWEWCQDRYGDYSSATQTNPKGATTGSNRVNRGGSSGSYGRYCRSSYRSYNTPGYSDKFLGLRLALTE